MKTLTKIKLINWHIFDNHTINITNNTLLTGENGHGKSTLLDALNFVLSGASGKFNQAANASTKRTIESYVRGKTGIEGKTYIREEEQIISHIALEFFDDFAKKFFTIGVIFELPFSKNTSHGTFYHIVDSKLHEEYFIFNQQILGLQQFIQAVQAKDKTIKTSNSKRDIKTMIKSVLGLSSDKYFELLPRALAFHPINEVNQFVYDFLLQEDQVDIESLQNNIYSYREVNKLLKNEKEKFGFIEPLENLAEQYKITADNIDLLKYLKIDLKSENYQSLIDQENRKLVEMSKNYEEALVDKSVIETKLLAVETSINELNNSDLSRRIDSLEKILQNESEKKKLIDQDINRFVELIKSEIKISNMLGLKFQGLENANASGHSQLINEINEYYHQIDLKKSELAINQSDIAKNMESLNHEKVELSNQIRKLESNRFTYDHNVERLLNILREELAIEFNNNSIYVKPLCELLDIAPEHEEWRNAVEGYLNTQRFDTIVEPQYFNKALEIYEKVKNKEKIHSVGLINTNKLSQFVSEPNALASKVVGFNEYARQALAMIMGKVICVNDIHELKLHSQSITSTGMTYRNNTARQINQAIWERPFIGQKAIKKQLENARKQESELNLNINSLIKKANHIKNLTDIINQSRIRELINLPNYFEEKDHLELRVKDLHDELAVMKKDNNWLGIQDRIVQKNAEKQNLNWQKEQLNKNMGSLETTIASGKQKIEELNLSFKAAIEEIADLPKTDHYDLQVEKKKTSMKEISGGNYEKLSQIIEKESNVLARQLVQHESKILDLMKEYTQKYDNGQLIPDIQNLSGYLEVYHRIKNRNIVEFQDQAASALTKCEKSFKEDFLSKLREKIQTAQDGFNQLNKALKTKPFGSDKEIYTFTYTGSSRPNFKDYYTILQTAEDYESKSLLVESLSEKNLILLKTLFDTLTSEDKSEAQVKRILEFTDYRKYMDYDIKITNRQGETYYFSKVNKEKSGGETQTPFYVIIASSFQQLLDSSNKNRSSACVVMFDEAFNNMDESRIEAMMEYYNALNIQLIIAVPPQRLVNIVPYVETTLGLIKSNNTVVVHSWKHMHQEATDEKL